MSYSDAVAEDWRDRAKLLDGQLAELRHKITKLHELHRPFGIHDECDCKPDDAGEVTHAGPAVVDCGEYETCEPAVYRICAHCCCGADGEQTEECVSAHDHGTGKPVCVTVAILRGAA